MHLSSFPRPALTVPLTAPSGVKIIKEGTTVSITPNAHYHVSNVIVGGVSQGAVSTYTFNNVTTTPTIEAQFAIDTYPLNVSLNSATGGMVASSIAGIGCGTDCSETYNYGTSLTLTATPNIAYNFTGWSGACTGTGICIVTMDTAKNVSANFAIKILTLNVSNYNPTGGTVNSSISGINCGTDCLEVYNYGTSVTLYGNSNIAYNFTGWSGACTGTNPCLITMDSSKSVAANFALRTFIISSTSVYTPYYSSSMPPGTLGGGYIVPSSAIVSYGGSQTFNIVPNPGNKISNVRIDGQSIGATSNYTFTNVTAPHNLTAQFYRFYGYQLPISVSLSNSAWGTITSPSGINCGLGGTTCSKVFDYGTYVELTATATAGHLVSLSGSGPCIEYIATDIGPPNELSQVRCIVFPDKPLNFGAYYYLRPYTIYASPVGAGRISPLPPAQVLFGGSSQTFTVTPSNGANISDVIIDGVSIGAVTNYTFTNIATNRTITAKFSCANLPVRIIRPVNWWEYPPSYPPDNVLTFSIRGYYPNLQAAYDAAAYSGDIIQVVEGIVENLTADKYKHVFIDGGYDCNYQTNNGKTTFMKGAIYNAQTPAFDEDGYPITPTIYLSNFTLIR